MLNHEHELELCAERDKYHTKLTLQMNEYNKLRDDYANKLNTRHQQICIRVAPSQPCTADEEAYVEGHVLVGLASSSMKVIFLVSKDVAMV